MTSADFTILITDDDDSIRETLRDLLEPQGYRTRMASNGEEAVDIARDESVHLALLDLHMPRMTGLDVLRVFRQIRVALPCILITADTSDAVMRQASQAQAFSVLHKPVSRGPLLHTLAKALARFYGRLRDERHQPEVPPRRSLTDEGRTPQ